MNHVRNDSWTLLVFSNHYARNMSANENDKKPHHKFMNFFYRPHELLRESELGLKGLHEASYNHDECREVEGCVSSTDESVVKGALLVLWR